MAPTTTGAKSAPLPPAWQLPVRFTAAVNGSVAVFGGGSQETVRLTGQLGPPLSGVLTLQLKGQAGPQGMTVVGGELQLGPAAGTALVRGTVRELAGNQAVAVVSNLAGQRWVIRLRWNQATGTAFQGVVSGAPLTAGGGRDVDRF